MAYKVSEDVRIKETGYTGKVVSKRSFLGSFFGILPRYEVGINLQNNCLGNKNFEMKRFYYGRSLEKLSQAGKVFNNIKNSLENK
ncbi:hypothetical protein GF378_01035 [Candidatus Pacearchaeota archaeon]|nr:hypothetical protein [Candidatus Pacearchaeota archaeon]